MSASKNPKSLRSLLTLELLAAFAKGSSGVTSEIVDALEVSGYNSNTAKVQVAQIRLCLLEKLGVELPFEPRGRMSHEQKKVLDSRLQNPTVKAAARQLLKHYFKAA